MKSRRIFLISFCIPVAIFVGCVLGLTIWQQKVTGDLTRTGRWSEREFGSRTPSPAFSVAGNLRHESAPDVLVLGDSFSRPNVWQTEAATKTGLKLLSWQIDQQHTCIDSWVADRLKEFPQVKTIVIESVERAIILRGTNNFNCGVDGSVFTEEPAYILNTARSYWPLTMNLEFVGHSLLHTIQENLRPAGEVRNEVVNVPLTRNDLFSNSRSDRLLYFTDDEPPWRASPDHIALALERFVELNAMLRSQGVRLIVLVVPDKSHVYRSVTLGTKLTPDKPDFAAELAKAGVESPVLLPAFVAEALSSVDFYEPDDTHLSVRGFRMLGDLVAPLWLH